MKHASDDATDVSRETSLISKLIRASCDDAGVSLALGLEELLAVHLAALLQANQRFNLSAIRDRDSAVHLHVVDSLMSVRDLEKAPIGPFADLGSGAGYPGIPLAVVTGRPADLIESIGKKAQFLREVATLLGPAYEIDVVNARAESVAGEGGKYSAVTARAVSSLPSLIELSTPLLVKGGRMIALKGRIDAAELDAGARVAKIVGMSPVEVREYALPGKGECRTIVIYERTGTSRVKLPRRDGLAQRRPL